MSETKKVTSKFRLFVENFIIYGMGSVISRLIPFIMLPIITRLMPDTTYFGISDMSNTITSFGRALAIIGMYDAMFRMFFEKDDEEFKRKVCSTAIAFTIASSVSVTLLMILFRDFVSKYFFGDIKYSYLVYITAATTLVTATDQILSAPTRMQNKRKIYILSNTVAPVISYLVAIPLILKGYYVIALPLAALIAGASKEITFLALNHSWFDFRLFDKNLLKQLLVIAIPLFPDFLFYWIFNSSDKLMITNIINVGASGIYSVGSKLGHCSQLLYTAFAGGWQYFAFSTMKEKNQVESNSRIFEYLGTVSFIASVFIFSLSRVIFNFLFTGDYIQGYVVAPYLFMAPLTQMLFQVACNQFLVIKKTWPNMFILMSGAAINIILNMVLIPMIGIEGAAIATLMGYVCSDIIACLVLCRMRLMIISKRFLLSSLLFAAYIIIWRFLTYWSVSMSLIAACILVWLESVLYKTEVKHINSKIVKVLQKKS